MREEIGSTDKSKSLFLEILRTLRARYVFLILFCLVSVVSAYVFCMLQPHKYRATTKVLLAPRVRSLDVVRDPLISNEYIRYFYYTQYIIMHNDDVLRDLVKKMGLCYKLSPYEEYVYPEEYALAVLKNALKIELFIDANVVEISVSLEKRHLAAEIANRFIELYKERRLVKEKAKVGEMLIDLKGQIDFTRQDLAEKEAIVQTLKGKQNLTIINGFNTDKMDVISHNVEYLNVKMERILREIKLEKIISIPENDKINMVMAGNEYPNLIKLKVLLAVEEIKLAYHKESLGDAHPLLVEARAKVKRIRSAVKDEVDGILCGLRIEYEIVKNRESNILALLEETKKNLIELQRDELEYLQAERDAQIAKALYVEMRKRYVEHISLYEMPDRNVEVIEMAYVPAEDDIDSPNYLLSLFCAGVSSLFLGAIFIIFFMFWERYSYLEVSSKVFSVMTVIPDGVTTLNKMSHDSDGYDAFRSIANDICIANIKGDKKTILVSSAAAGEGKTMVAVNLAMVLSDIGKRVLVIDANMINPELPDRFDIIPYTDGLINIDEHRDNYKELIQPFIYPHVDMISAGRPQKENQRIVGIKDFESVLGKLKSDYEYIIFDSSPIIGFSDTLYLSRLVDGILLVEGHRMFPVESDKIIKKYLADSNSKIIGTILNKVSESEEIYRYYYQKVT